MMRTVIWGLVAIWLWILMVEQEARAQVPPHTPGTICFTSGFWCWAQPPGKPGGACTCPSPTGPVKGTLN